MLVLLSQSAKAQYEVEAYSSEMDKMNAIVLKVARNAADASDSADMNEGLGKLGEQLSILIEELINS